MIDKKWIIVATIVLIALGSLTLIINPDSFSIILNDGTMKASYSDGILKVYEGRYLAFEDYINPYYWSGKGYTTMYKSSKCDFGKYSSLSYYKEEDATFVKQDICYSQGQLTRYFEITEYNIKESFVWNSTDEKLRVYFTWTYSKLDKFDEKQVYVDKNIKETSALMDFGITNDWGKEMDNIVRVERFQNGKLKIRTKVFEGIVLFDPEIKLVKIDDRLKSKVVDNIFPTLKSNENIGKATFTLDNPLPKIDVSKFDITFNEVCGRVDSWSIQEESFCNETTPNYKTIEVCINQSVYNNVTFQNETIEVCSDEIYLAGYNTIIVPCLKEVQTIKSGINDYIISADLRMERCSDGSFGYIIDWIPEITLNKTFFKQEKWAWWNSTWKYRTNITLNNPDSFNHDFEIIYLNDTFIPSTNCSTDPDSTRVVFNNSLMLDFEWYNSSKTSLYFIANTSIASGNNFLYSLYCDGDNNIAEGNTSIFTWRDDFEDGDLSDWTDDGTFTIQTDIPKQGVNYAKIVSTSGYDIATAPSTGLGSNTGYVVWYGRSPDLSISSFNHGFRIGKDGSNEFRIYWGDGASPEKFGYFDGSTVSFNTNSFPNIWESFKLDILGSDNACMYFNNSFDKCFNALGTATDFNYFYFDAYVGGYDNLIDYVFAGVNNMSIFINPVSITQGVEETEAQIDTNFSIWTGSAWANAYDYYMDFRCTPTQTECEPDNQDIGSSQSIYKVCNNGTVSGTTVQMMMGVTLSAFQLAYFSAEEGSGSVAIDNWNGNNGTLFTTIYDTNSPTFNSTGSGGTYSYNMTTLGTSYVQLDSLTAFDFNPSSDKQTISIWVKSTESMWWITKDGGSINDMEYRIMGYTGGGVTYQYGHYNTGPVSSINTSDGNWHHIVATASPSILKLYIDGVLIDTVSRGGTTPYAGYAYIGARGDTPDKYGQGNFDELKIWKGLEATAVQVSNLYNYGSLDVVTDIVLKCDDDYSYVGAITLSASNQTIHGTLAIDACIDISCWADYSNPSAGGFFDTFAYVI